MSWWKARADLVGSGRARGDSDLDAKGAGQGPRHVGVWGFNALLVVAAAAGAALLLSRPGLGSGSPRSWAWVVLAAVLVLVRELGTRMVVRQTHVVFDLHQLPVVVAAAILAPSQLLLGALAGSVVTRLIHRGPIRQGIFNLANQMVGVSVVFLVLRSLAAPPGSDHHIALDAHNCLALAAALGAGELFTCLAVVAVMTVANGFPGRGFVAQVGLQVVILTPINLIVAVGAIAAYETRPWALVGVVLPMILVGWWYSGSEKMRRRFADLQLLYGYSRALAATREQRDVVRTALQETQKALHCEHAELCVSGARGLVRYRLDPLDAVVEEAVAPDGPEARVLATQQPLRLSPSSGDAYLASRGLKDALAVPLSINDATGAVLMVTDSHGERTVSFGPPQTDFLQALAAQLSTALTSSEHLEDLRRSIDQREHQAFHDALTGMANRTLFAEAVSSSLERSGGNRTTAVVLIDLDEFRSVNEALGHRTGDRVLEVVGARLSAEVEAKGMAARLGGDEFAFLVPAATSIDEVVHLAELVVESLSVPMDLDQVSFSVRAAVGIAVAPLHGRDAATLLKNADVAMYAAKRSGRRIQVYETSMDKSSARRLGLATDLARAIDGDELELWYQPVADIGTGTVAGFEALLRWPHPEHGFVGPDEFIPIAEQTGLIEPLTWWVMEQALRELRAWRDNGYEFSMAVNVSVRSLLDAAIVERLRTMVADFGLSAPSLTLEITESAMMTDFERCETVLRLISELGIKIAIDDFGTGYSSLSRLKTLPVHVVKIDRSFVKSICNDRADQAIVKSVIELARVMGHQTLAEGIEDLATWSRLAALGCELGQGYYYARPMPAAQCRAWVGERQPPRLAAVRELAARRAEGN